MNTIQQHEACRKFYSLPYAGNHTMIGEPYVYGYQEAKFIDDDGNVWMFSYDKSWDNVQPLTFNGDPLF